MDAAAQRVRVLWPAGLAVLLSACWPLSSYVWNPLVLPTALALIGGAVLVVVRPEYGIALVLALSPFTNAVIGGQKPLHMLLPALSAGVLALGLLSPSDDRAPNSVRAATIATTAFVVAVGLASLFALDPAQSVTRFFGLLTAVLLFYAVARICREPHHLLAVSLGAVAGLLLAAIHGIVQHATGTFYGTGGALIDGQVVGRIYGAFGHPNSYAGYLALLIPLGIGLAVTRGVPGHARLAGGAAAVVAVYPLLLTYTRGALIALIVGGIVWLVVVRPRAALPAALIVGLLLIFAAPPAVQDRLRDRNATDVGLRTDLWASALQIYAERPILGSGPNNFALAYGALPSVQATGAQRRLLHQGQLLLPPHANNLYLTMLAETGIVGAAALVFLLGAALAVARAATHVRDPIGRAVGIGFGTGTVTLALHAILEFTLFGETGQAFFAMFAVTAALVARDRAQTALMPPDAPGRTPVEDRSAQGRSRPPGRGPGLPRRAGARRPLEPGVVARQGSEGWERWR